MADIRLILPNAAEKWRHQNAHTWPAGVQDGTVVWTTVWQSLIKSNTLLSVALGASPRERKRHLKEDLYKNVRSIFSHEPRLRSNPNVHYQEHTCTSWGINIQRTRTENNVYRALTYTPAVAFSSGKHSGLRSTCCKFQL